MKQFNPTRYIRETYRTYVFRVDRRKDPELLRVLEEKENLSSYIRSLIYMDMGMKEHGKQKKCI